MQINFQKITTSNILIYALIDRGLVNQVIEYEMGEDIQSQYNVIKCGRMIKITKEDYLF